MSDLETVALGVSVGV
jgi:hypothetical protein